ncbi:MAG: GTP-binding protein [Planctomycetota bacterium]|nr:GTP-binding protein [Planctomycetota bacterium]
MSDAEPSVFAHLTAPGRGGIAVIRCTGPRVAGTLKACFRPVRRGDVPPALGCLAYGHVVDADGRVLDEVILHRAGPATWEVNCHGGPVVVEAVCDRLASLGLVRVDPDALLAAEGAGPVERAARRLLQTAATPLAARILLDQLNGALERAVAQVDDALTAGRPDEAAGALDTLLARWRTCGRYLAEAPRLVIAGRPNVGKSTLLNRLAGHERAITHAEPGTTRDYVETVAAFEGLPVVLVDTAGLREAVGRVEREGVARARRQASAAALVVYLLDVEAGVTAADEAALAHLGDCALAVWNKADLASGPLGPPAALAVSALTGAGLDDLRREGLARLAYRAPSAGAAVPLMREQEERLRCAAGLLADGRCEEAAQRLAALLPHG